MHRFDPRVSRNTVAKTISGADITSRTSTTTYGHDGAFPIQKTNTLGHSEYRVHDARFGVVTQLLGPNGLLTTWSYDDFGRKEAEVRADGTMTTWVRSECVGCAPNSKYSVTTSTTGSSEVIAYHDVLGRVVRKESTGFNNATIYQDTVYDDAGRVDKKSRPYFTTAQPKWTEYTYDVNGKIFTETAPDGTVTKYDYQGLKATIHADLYGKDQKSIQWKDALGKLRKVEDNLGNNTTYDYDPFGNLIKVTDAVGNETTMSYDIRGRKKTMDDPDMGHWEYDYDVLGQLIWQQDAKGQIVTMEYDKLGRMTKRTEPEGVSEWSYDSAPGKGIGKLHMVTGLNGYEKVITYDSLGRKSDITTTILYEDYTISYTYDNKSRVDTVTYPTGFATRNIYDNNSILERVDNAETGDMYWQAQGINASGQVTMEELGNGLSTVNSYDPDTGLLEGISTGATSGVQNLTYVYDALGNLTERQDPNQGLTEQFTYDGLNRLTEAEIVGYGTTTYTYDEIGNITNNSNIGDYIYGENDTGGNTTTCNGTQIDLNSTTGGPHAATVVYDETTCSYHKYEYDANGNMVKRDGNDIVYSSFNKPTDISQGTATFQYAPDRSRIVQTSISSTTVYLSPRADAGTHYEKQIKNNVTSNIHYIYGGTGLIGTYTSRDNGTEDTRYFHKDHLGSIDVITDETGSVVERLAYDPFGKRRAPLCEGTDPSCVLISSVTHHGFTGHEHLEEVGLIHMNGRVYDPLLSRFLSPDSNVQAPANPQNLNRYSYINNNPMSGTDPSGFFFKKLFKKLFKYSGFKAAYKWTGHKALVNFIKKEPIAQGVVTVAAGASCGIAGPACVALAATVFTRINGGSWGDALKAGAISGATAAAFMGVGELGEATSFFDGLHITKIVLHGAVGGLSSEAMGGSFKAGFMSAAFTQAAAPGIGAIKPRGADARIMRVTVAASVGGTASELGGGKFANGATTFGFLRLFRELPGYYRQKVGYDPDIGPGGDAVQKTDVSPPVEGANNIGVQGLSVQDPCFFCEGGPVSNAANQIPGINAVAGMHDVFQISMGDSIWRNVLNVPGMPVAAGVTYGSFVGQALNAMPANLYIPFNVGRRNNKDRDPVYLWAPAGGF